MTLEQFWSTREKKTWVVTLMAFGRRSKLESSDTKYVRASTREGAIRIARENSSLKNAEASARLAHPEKDLGCVWSGNGPNPLQESLNSGDGVYRP